MLDLFHIAKPQNCNIQTFYGDGSNTNSKSKTTWAKPIGVSHVYMLLIGSGGNGNGSTGGGSGAVTVYYTAAQNIPNTLSIWVGVGTTYVAINNSGSPASMYIQAQSASGSTAGAASAAPVLAAQGFYQSIAGQAGSAGGVSASTTTFLSGGGVLGGNTVTANYGYSTQFAGFFQLQPIIVGCGATGTNNPGGIGCGGSYTTAGQANGGPGMVLIASW